MRSGVVDSKGQLGKDKIVAAAKELSSIGLASSDIRIRVASAEALALTVQVVRFLLLYPR